MEYIIPKENYLRKPGNESCYEYLLMAYERISKDYGDDYTAFVIPVANVESEITMKRFIADIEKLASWFASKGIGKGDVVTAFLDEFNAALRRHGSTAFLTAGYGLTEMAAVCAVNDVLGKEYRTDTVGHPILGTHIEIWDDKCNKLPAGVEGEVVIAGETMMNRYLPDDVVQESGVYTDENGKNWIRTGDVGMITEDGHIKFTSRIKRIILISGYNIYPATIERKVLSLDYIAEACACQGYDENGKPYVKLVVAPANAEADRDELTEKLMAFCKDNIEGYSCPRKIIVVDALPRTKMEKIDFIKLSDVAPQA